MLSKLRDAFKVPEIRKRIFFILLVLAVIRLAAQIPTPGVNTALFTTWFEQQTADSGAMGFLNTMTGGSFSSMSIVALSITPYITASIILQLLTIAIPKLEEMQKEGEEGRKKIRSITRYLNIGLSLMEGLAMGIGFYRSNYLTERSWTSVIVVMITLTAGSAFLMWLGEQINVKGVGNGISIILMINILSGIPADIAGLFTRFVSGASNIVTGAIAAIIIVAIILFMVIFVVILDGGERRIPVQYSRKVVGRQMAGGNSSSIPLKVNTAGVMPIIFASSLLSIPSLIISITGSTPTGFWGHVVKLLSQRYWFDPTQPIYTLGVLIYVALLIFFAYFYTSITFNPIEIADNLKKNGGFVPGIRPGRPTSDHLNGILKGVIFIGAVGLAVVALVPIVFSGVFNASVSFGGTSLIIIIGVILETMKQIESMMVVRHYQGFLGE